MSEMNFSCYGSLVLQWQPHDFVDRTLAIDTALQLVRKHKMPVRLLMREFYVFVLESDTMETVEKRLVGIEERHQAKINEVVQQTLAQMARTDEPTITN